MAYVPTGRPRGRPKKTADERAQIAKDKIRNKNNKLNFKSDEQYYCQHCGETKVAKEFYKSISVFHNGHLPMCKSCIEDIYNQYCEKYREDGNNNPEKNAVRRICMAFDVYYRDSLYKSALKRQKTKVGENSTISAYLSICQLSQYNDKTYDKTIQEDGGWSVIDIEEKPEVISEKTIKFFGKGFTNEDYEFLQTQYSDWITRHECDTKVQEEIFKQLCFVQLDILKANRMGKDTKDLTMSFQKLLDSAKLQPKQVNSETFSNAQTFGTLIDKWEYERPIPDVDPELQDVDKIGAYLDTFFKGHLAKMMGLKNGVSNLYTKYMKRYTVEKPEYSSDEDNEALFDAIFGNQILDDD